MSGKNKSEVDISKLSVKECRAMIRLIKAKLRRLKAEQKLLSKDRHWTELWKVEMLRRKRNEWHEEYARLVQCYHRTGIPELTLGICHQDRSSLLLKAELINAETGAREYPFSLEICQYNGGPLGRYAERAEKYCMSRRGTFHLYMFKDSSDFWATVYEKVQSSSRTPFDRFFHRGRIYYFATLMKPSRGKKK